MEDALRLAEMREARGATQIEVSEILGVSQANVSQLERRDDLYLSTLQGYVEALGGKLVLLAVFPDETFEVATSNGVAVEEQCQTEEYSPEHVSR